MARAAAEAIQNCVSISFFLFVFGCCLCYHRENRAQNAPKQEGAVMEKIKLEIAGIPAVLYGKRSRRVYLYVHGKNGSATEAARFARTACPAGWQVLAVDLPEHGTRKNSPEKLVPWVVTRELQTVYARMQPGVETYSGVWGQHRCVVCHAGVADANAGKGTACLPGGGYGKADP